MKRVLILLLIIMPNLIYSDNSKTFVTKIGDLSFYKKETIELIDSETGRQEIPAFDLIIEKSGTEYIYPLYSTNYSKTSHVSFKLENISIEDVMGDDIPEITLDGHRKLISGFGYGGGGTYNEKRFLNIRENSIIEIFSIPTSISEDDMGRYFSWFEIENPLLINKYHSIDSIDNSSLLLHVYKWNNFQYEREEIFRTVPTIINNRIKLMSEPNKSSSILTEFEENSQICIIGKNENNDRIWYKVRLLKSHQSEKVGWILRSSIMYEWEKL